MKRLSKDKRDRLILVVVGTLAIIIGLWYGLITQQRKALDRIAERAREQEQKVKNGQRLVASSADLQQSVEKANAKLRAIEQTMASGDMYSWIILTMNKFRANRQVDIPQFSREVTTEVGVLPRFPYRAALFNVRGTAFYHDFGKFIADFENTFPILRVQNVELEPASSSSATQTPDAEKLAFKMEIVALINPMTY